MQLTKYDAARRALAEAHRVDEVKDIRDKAVAMQTYARQAKDEDLIQHATEIRMRAERRIGELMAEAKEAGHLAKPGPTSKKIGAAADPISAKSLHDAGVDKHLADRARKMARLSENDFEKKVEGAKQKAVSAIDGSPANPVRGTQGTGENEWYTPKAYIDAARSVLGEIDLDPATSSFAQRRVKAEEFFTIDDDGLAKEWKGRVWLNPPYAQPYIAQFAAKMVAEVAAGRVKSAIMLTHNYTDTSWFHEAVSACAAICFTRGRVKFEQSNGDVAAPTQGQAFFYYGKNVAAFRKVFGAIGFVVTP